MPIMDDDAILRVLSRISRDTNYDVCTLNSPFRAIEELDVLIPNVPVVDMWMPEMAGAEFLKLSKGIIQTWGAVLAYTKSRLKCDDVVMSMEHMKKLSRYDPDVMIVLEQALT